METRKCSIAFLCLAAILISQVQGQLGFDPSLGYPYEGGSDPYTQSIGVYNQQFLKNQQISQMTREVKETQLLAIFAFLAFGLLLALRASNASVAVQG